MTVIAGIDEAGFGPILGPLVVSGVKFLAPDTLAAADWWELLAPAVSKTARKRDMALAIGDSKKLHTPAAGLTNLERGVLGVLGMASPRTNSLRDLLGWLSPATGEQMQRYPWYVDADVDLPTTCQPAAIRLRTKPFAAALAEKGMEFSAARSEILLVDEYNRMIAVTDNKATTLLGQTCRLIDWAWRTRPAGENVTVFVDRQGGRAHYLPVLQRMYAGRTFKILAERPALSAYRITGSDGILEAHFVRKGDSVHLPVALASMISKYLRELFMSLLNAYWARQMDGEQLKPTAGYYTDGKRFLADIDAARNRLATAEQILIRSR